MANINYMGFTFKDLMEMDSLVSDIFKKYKMAISISLKNNSVLIKNLNRQKQKLNDLDEAFVRVYFELLYGVDTTIRVLN